MSNTPEKDFNIRNNFVEGKYARSNKANFMNFNKANFMNFNIPTSNRFDIYVQFKILKMTQSLMTSQKLMLQRPGKVPL